MILEGRGEGRWGAEQIPLPQPSSTPLCFYCPTPTSTLPHPQREEAWGRDCSGMETLGGDKQTQPLMHCPHCSPSLLDSPSPSPHRRHPRWWCSWGSKCLGEGGWAATFRGGLQAPPVLQRRKLSLREGQTVSQGYSARRLQGLGWTPGLCDKGTSSDFKQRTEGFEGRAPTAWGGEIPRTMDSMLLPMRVAISCPILYCYCIPVTHLLPDFLIVAGYFFTSANLQI